MSKEINASEVRGLDSDRIRHLNPADAFPAGTVLNGPGVFLGKKWQATGEGTEWTLRIGKRDGNNFMGTIQHHDRKFDVGGSLPADANGRIHFRTRRGEDADIAFTGEFQRATLVLTFEGERNKQKMAGKVELKAK